MPVYFRETSLASPMKAKHHVAVEETGDTDVSARTTASGIADFFGWLFNYSVLFALIRMVDDRGQH